jgi:hypothetical protein
MALTSAQNATLKAEINASPTLSAYPNTPEGNTDMCNQQLNLNAVPNFIVWRTNVSIVETGESFDGTEWSDMTAGNLDRLSCVAVHLSQYDASRDDIREMYDDIWSGAGGAITRVNLLALWKRVSLLGEKILAVGTGTDAVPAKMSYVGSLTEADVAGARNS